MPKSRASGCSGKVEKSLIPAVMPSVASSDRAGLDLPDGPWEILAIPERVDVVAIDLGAQPALGGHEPPDISGPPVGSPDPDLGGVFDQAAYRVHIDVGRDLEVRRDSTSRIGARSGT